MVGSRSNNSNSGGRTAQLGVVAALLQEMDGIATSQGDINLYKFHILRFNLFKIIF